MPYLKYQGRDFFSREDENILDTLLRHGISIPFSCRNGICQVCLQRCVQGTVPDVAQRGLKQELRDQGYFMACKCIPQRDMEVAPPSGLFSTTLVHSKAMLTRNVCRLRIEPPASFVYHPGQFTNIRRQDGLVRSYSIASLPAEDYFLEIHVQRKDGGVMSNWILDELNAGDTLDIQNASGECYYKGDAHGPPLLLIGNGTGLSPLFGILRDALRHQHRGEIHLYHGSRDTDGFYLREKLRQLEQQHANFHYHECISGKPVPPEHAGQAHEVAFKHHKDLYGWHVYLAGLAEMVSSGEFLAKEQGAAPEAIHADAFALRNLRQSPNDIVEPAISSPSTIEENHTSQHNIPTYPSPSPELWAALGDGKKLMEVLQDFYGQVFQDDRLASFFHRVTKQRSIEKQFLFMRQILTGEKVYFGDRPRNSHHWMVISDELFDYRREIMESCLRKHGLSEPMVQRYSAIEEFFRRDIVKSRAFARVMGDVALPFEGFDEITMDVGTLCDTCEREVMVGEKAIYHVRLGKIYCSDCNSSQNQ